jgi:chromosome segregation ATPase
MTQYCKVKTVLNDEKTNLERKLEAYEQLIADREQQIQFHKDKIEDSYREMRELRRNIEEINEAIEKL